MTSKPGLISSRLRIIECIVFACNREGTPPHGPLQEKKREKKRREEIKMRDKKRKIKEVNKRKEKIKEYSKK